MEGNLVIDGTTHVPVVFSVSPGGREGRISALLPTGLPVLLRLYNADEAVLLQSKSWHAHVSILSTKDVAAPRPWFRFRIV